MAACARSVGRVLAGHLLDCLALKVALGDRGKREVWIGARARCETVEEGKFVYKATKEGDATGRVLLQVEGLRDGGEAADTRRDDEEPARDARLGGHADGVCPAAASIVQASHHHSGK
eukprot:scaffold12296_cov27-Tisochrysis_lutea.AAC.2